VPYFIFLDDELSQRVLLTDSTAWMEKLSWLLKSSKGLKSIIGLQRIEKASQLMGRSACYVAVIQRCEHHQASGKLGLD
jgi:hypothetical protein